MSQCRVTTFDSVVVALVVNSSTGARLEVRFSIPASLYHVEFLADTFETIEEAIESAKKYLVNGEVSK